MFTVSLSIQSAKKYEQMYKSRYYPEELQAILCDGVYNRTKLGYLGKTKRGKSLNLILNLETKSSSF